MVNFCATFGIFWAAFYFSIWSHSWMWMLDGHTLEVFSEDNLSDKLQGEFPLRRTYLKWDDNIRQ